MAGALRSVAGRKLFRRQRVDHRKYAAGAEDAFRPDLQEAVRESDPAAAKA
jgi:hypothetical protein